MRVFNMIKVIKSVKALLFKKQSRAPLSHGKNHVRWVVGILLMGLLLSSASQSLSHLTQKKRIAAAEEVSSVNKSISIEENSIQNNSIYTQNGSSITLQPANIVNAIRKTEAQIHNFIERKQIPGCAIAVVYRNNVIFMSGYGVRTIGKDDKIDANTVFQLGSISKPIAATLATMLEEKGKLNVEDPVIQYLPDFTLNNKSDPTTFKVKNVLSHTSGVPRNGFNNLIENFTPYPEILSAIQQIRARTPGQKYDYHNAVYSLIGKITEKVTSLSFAEALRNYLTHPLQMKSTTATYEGLMQNINRASPHTRNGKGALCACEPYSQGYYAVSPAGGINSSVHDMAIFLKAQMGGHTNVLSRNVITKMHTPIIPTTNYLGRGRSSDPSYGLGWRIINYADQKLVYHGGWLKGFTNFLAFMPEQELGIVVLHNGDTKFSSRLAQGFFDVALGLPEVKDTGIKGGKSKKGKKASKASKAGKTPAKASKSGKAKKAKSGGGKKGKGGKKKKK